MSAEWLMFTPVLKIEDIVMKENEIKAKARAIAGQLTLEEKIGMIHGSHLFATKGVERLGIPPLVMSDGPMGVRQEFEPDHWKAVGYSDDYVTYLPCNSALAATWNRELASAMGSVLGEESRGRGKDVILAPGINIKRSPLCGRNFEYYSEDPLLTGRLAGAMVRGIQSQNVAATVKHFACNNKETNRKYSDSRLSQRALREIYLRAFEIIVREEQPWAIMSSYNVINGQRASESRELLTTILREEWGYAGLVMSDWWTRGEHYKELLAGNDLKMANGYPERVEEAVRLGAVSRSDLETCARRVLELILEID